MIEGPASARPVVLVLMGVSGCGKTTVAKVLVEKLGWAYQEGDDLHPPANVEKMHAGIPLTDEDRWPWLRTVAAWIQARLAAGESGIVTCSALKRAYRDILVAGDDRVRIVYLRGDKALIAQRLAARRGHYMPASLLDSQFATLEEPGPDERAIVAPIAETAEEAAARIISALGAGVVPG